MKESQAAQDIKKLSVAERILLVEGIWDSIAADQESIEVTQEQREELDRRVQAYRSSPTEGSSWEEIKSRLQRTQRYRFARH